MNFFLNRYKKLGQEIDPEAIDIKRSIRLNTLKVSEPKLLNRLEKNSIKLTKIPWLDHGYYSESDFSVASTPEYLQGYFYIQEAASQVPAQILNPKETDVVLDMCAAPGGKTSQLAQIMNNKGKIIALDNNPARLKALQNNLERMGVKNTITYNKDARYFDELKFDKILLDAPCSGNFCTDPNWFEKRDITDIKQCGRMQKELLKAAASLLKEGGEIVYSTCSLEPEEDEEVIEWALDELGLKLLPIDFKAGSPGTTEKTSKCIRFWPNKEKTEGFFVAKLRL